MRVCEVNYKDDYHMVVRPLHQGKTRLLFHVVNLQGSQALILFLCV